MGVSVMTGVLDGSYPDEEGVLSELATFVRTCGYTVQKSGPKGQGEW